MKKGFTLIELLAVILILGVIALIAIPTVNNIISEAEESAARRNAEQYINAVEQAVTIQDMKGNTIIGAKSVEDLKDLVKLKGTLPSSGNVVIEDNEVIACNLKIRDYAVICNDGELVLNKSVKGNITPQLVVDNNHNGQADMNDKICIDTECFYVISRNSSKIRMLAEWNLNVGYSASYDEDFDESQEVFISYNPRLQAGGWTDVIYKKLNPNVIKQDSTMVGYVSRTKSIGIIPFTLVTEVNENEMPPGYWVASDYSLKGKYGSKYPAYVYDSNSNLYSYVNNYVGTLKNMIGNQNITGNLISYDELISLGLREYESTTYICNAFDVEYGYTIFAGYAAGTVCESEGQEIDLVPRYLFQVPYWSGSAGNGYDLWVIDGGTLSAHHQEHCYMRELGLRPVIEIPTSLVK